MKKAIQLIDFELGKMFLTTGEDKLKKLVKKAQERKSSKSI
jgi:hypothetical protein